MRRSVKALVNDSIPGRTHIYIYILRTYIYKFYYGKLTNDLIYFKNFLHTPTFVSSFRSRTDKVLI